MVTNYTTKSYIKSGMRFRSRKLLVLYIKSHIYTKFNTPKQLFHYHLYAMYNYTLKAKK